MFEEMVGMLIGELADMNSILLLGVFAIFVIVAFKVFKTMVKGVMVAAVSAVFPLVAMYFEIPLPAFFASMPILERVFWFGVLGIALFFIYSSITGGVKIIKIVTWPFRILFKGSPKKEKIIIKEKEED